MITGDKTMGPGHPRFDLQAFAVEKLVPLYWGRGSLWPTVPQEKFDVVTVQDPFWRGLFAWRVARKLAARLNVQVHTDLSAQSFFRHVVAQIILRHADSVRVVSQKLKTQVERIGVHASITILPVYVDLEKFKTIVPVAHEQKTILWVGRFEQEKDPLAAVKVFKEIHPQLPGSKLIMLGKGTLGPSLKARAAGLPIEFPGWQDPAQFLARADVVLCTSLHESWGASIVEALAAGVGVVAPDVGVAKEAGAVVVSRSELATAVIEALRAGSRGRLQLPLLSSAEWTQEWKKTL